MTAARGAREDGAVKSNEELENDVVAHYTQLKQESPELRGDDLVPLIAERLGRDAEAQLAAGEDDGAASFIREFVHEMESAPSHVQSDRPG